MTELLAPGTMDDVTAPPLLHVVRNGGVAVVLSFAAGGLPEVLHWGRDLGDLDDDDARQLLLATRRQVSSSALDEPWPLTILPTETDGWQGRPAFAATRDGVPIHPRWEVAGADGASDRLTVTAFADDLELTSIVQLDPAGVLRVRHTVANRGAAAVTVAALEATMPFGSAATEVLDLAGRWTRERTPQRRPLLSGSHVRETRRGRTGHDSPTLLALGTQGFGDEQGELWAVHLAWSADAVYRYDSLPEAAGLLGAAELARPGEILLAAGESFTTPDAVFVWSDEGLDGLSARLHASLRTRPRHPSTRPVFLNTWEAVYFDHDLGALTQLAELAAATGVERFVLDDGWFRHRRHDRAGLGDWFVDETVWPHGLRPLVDRVKGLGLEFGLWVEPEMVNLDSDLARAHPDWLLEPAGRIGREWRHQHVLDVALPEVAAYLEERIASLVAEYGIDYLKWDQNRDLLEAVHEGRTGVDAHTRAVYALLDRLRERFPLLEIESCASGGARVDLGILERTDRVWASDTNDPVERVPIQRWTQLLIPPELVGSHVGAERSHTTGRKTDLSFRLAVSLFASAGIEADLRAFDADELEQVRDWIALYKRVRGMLHSGRVRHPSHPDPGLHVEGVVAADGGTALFRAAQLASSDRALPAHLRLSGLDRARRYSVRPVRELRMPHLLDSVPPPWLAEGVVLPGSVLEDLGLRMPLLGPGQALVVEVEATS